MYQVLERGHRPDGLWVRIRKTKNKSTRKFNIVVNIITKMKFFSVMQDEESLKKILLETDIEEGM